MNITETMKKYGEMLSTIDFPLGDDVRILMKDGSACYSTRIGADLAALTEEDILDITGQASPEKAALIASPEFQCMIISHPEYAQMCIDQKVDMPAVMDDMAQIVGLKVRLVRRERLDISSALRRASAVMIEKGPVITCGRTMYEAFTCLTVLEKNAEIYQKSAVFGGAATVKPVSGIIEHIVYKRKYSKAERKRKNADEGRN